MPRIAVLVPCYNEEVAIPRVVQAFRAALPEATVYVYDNNSKDRTVEVARAAGETGPLLFTTGVVSTANPHLSGTNTALSTQIFRNAQLPFPAAQERLWLIGHVEAPASWIEFYARRPVTELRSAASLERVRRLHPDDLVFIVPGCVDEPACRAAGTTDRARLEPARSVGQGDTRR